MFEGFSFHYRHWQLERSKHRLYRRYEKDIKEARKRKKSDEEIESIYDNERFGAELIDDAIAQLLTRYYSRQATKNFLPRPPRDSWEESSITGDRYLTREAIRDLRIALRQERKERSENLRLWLAGLTGLVGALTGLAALLLKH